MDSRKVLYNKVSGDENYTPRYAVVPILPFIPKGVIVWLPFDTKDSWFYKLIRKQNPVVRSHIDDGKDFFTYEPKKWDMIISNPPWKNKRRFFERALGFHKPFALLMTLTWLNDSAPKIIFPENNQDLQLLMFDKRIKFTNTEGRPNNKITFSSAYYCTDFLPRDIIMQKLDTKIKLED